MSIQTIQVEVRTVYGREAIYPVNQAAKRGLSALVSFGVRPANPKYLAQTYFISSPEDEA